MSKDRLLKISNIRTLAIFLVVLIHLIAFGACAYFLTELVRKTKLRFVIGE